MRYNTGSPLEPDGSGDPRDLHDNSKIIDKLVNGTELTLLGRLGKMLKTWSGMMADFTAMMSGFGYEPNHLVYVDGQPLQVDRTTQLIDYNGAVYGAKMPADFPLMLTGSWGSDSSKLVDVGDQALRAQLAFEDGAKTLVGGALFKGEALDPGTVAEGTSVTRGFAHAYYPERAGAIRVGGSDSTSLNDKRNYLRGMPSQDAWGDTRNIGLYSRHGTDSFAGSRIKLQGIKADRSSQPIIDIIWSNPNSGSSAAELNISMNGRSSVAFSLKEDGTSVFGELKAAGQLNYPVKGAVYQDGGVLKVIL